MKPASERGNNLLQRGLWLFAPIFLAFTTASPAQALSAPQQAHRHQAGEPAAPARPQTGALLFNPPYEFVDRKIGVELARLDADVANRSQAYQQSLVTTYRAIANARAAPVDKGQWLTARRMSWQTVEVGQTLCSALEKKLEYILRVRDTAPQADRDQLQLLAENDSAQRGGVMKGLADILSLLAEPPAG